MRTLLWFRGKDLRVSDHGPLRDAVRAGEVIPLFVLEPDFFAPARARGAAHHVQFLLESLRALEARIGELGSRLVVVSGESAEVVPRLARQWRVDRVVAQRWIEPFGRERERRVRSALEVPLALYEGETLLPPEAMRTAAGRPFSRFADFARSFAKSASIGRPIPAPRALPPLPADLELRAARIPTCGELGLRENPGVLAGGEREAQARLRRFLRGPAGRYDQDRDRLDLAGTSRLSADLQTGTLSVRTVWSAAEAALGQTGAARSFLNELLWREFNDSTLWEHPRVLEEPYRREFMGLAWDDDERLWEAWVAGRTGYPVVDAAARQLLGEGFVHNRARMISASFLVKHLMADYRRGEAFYMKYLTDGDLAQNNGNWQWIAGCGCDAQPYFRIFNPVSQGQRFDPNGDYVRRWVPELARLPARFIHRPWDAPDSVLRAAGVRWGEDYPRPIVSHPEARSRYLARVSAHLRERRSRR